MSKPFVLSCKLIFAILLGLQDNNYTLEIVERLAHIHVLLDDLHIVKHI